MDLAARMLRKLLIFWLGLMPRICRLFCSMLSSVALSCGFVAAQMDTSRINAVAQHVNRGISLMRARQFQAAMSEFEAAKAVDPNNRIVKSNIADCFNNMGINLYNHRNYSDAIVQFEHCLEIQPQHAQARRNIELCRQRMDIEGIPDTPSAPDDKLSKKPQKDTEADNKKDDAGPKVNSGGSEITVSAGGTKLYANGTGSTTFPTYSEKPSAATGGQLPWMPKQTPPAVIVQPADSIPSGVASTSVPASVSTNSAATVASQASSNSSSSGSAQSGAAQSESGAKSTSKPTTDPFDSGPPTDPAFTQPVSPAAANSTSKPNNSTSFGASVIPTSPATSSMPEAPSGFNASASNARPSGDGSTLEEKVAALELKVYGQKNSGLPIMKRLEKLEIDHGGQTRQGSMSERVDYLKQVISKE